MTRRDRVKLALQYQEQAGVPFTIELDARQEGALTAHFGGPAWQARSRPCIVPISGVDIFLSRAGFAEAPGGAVRDALGCTWQMGTTHHLVDWPLREPRLGGYRLPDLAPYFDRHLRPRWPADLAATADQFRVVTHGFGLFERAWSLRGFEDFLVDLALNRGFAEELLEHIMEWILGSVDLMAGAPVDGIVLTDDHADQRGILMGASLWRRLFKPRWKRLFERVHRYGLYTLMHMCGNTAEVVPDLIEIGLDCMESCQPECMDLRALKREYGRDIRFWGGLSAQRTMPFGSPEDVRAEARRLKREMGAGGGFILAPAKAPGPEVPAANIAAFLEEAWLSED